MYVFLETNSNRMIRYIEDESKKSTVFDVREVCIRFTLENVSACAFGLEGKNFDQPYSDFRELADKFLSPESMSKIKFIILVVCPWIAKFMKMKFISAEVEKRLIDMVSETLKYRKENNIVRNDFLDAMSQIKTEDGLFSEIDIVANAASFFGDGYETSSRVMTFAIFELAQNSGAQGRLREEINETLAKNGNKFTYELISQMPYLDACLQESMRKDSLVYQLNKTCTEDYTYISTSSDFKPIKINIKAGTPIVLPIEGFHNDSRYFADPERFLPERFLDKQDDGFRKHTYFPFGDGPRMCLGLRFGITQIKVGIAHIIKNYQLSVNSRTQLPLKFDPYYIMADPIGGLWADFHKIN
ncbi:unnamed protein product [Psylliodes chrysocephalus]|uniref:Cytochrome P450 n=1 Tax=Psylliodes chrysocephalus TaxID=3402493 RepID=A0A9P0GIN4_9CUCU|nr:unnamed protein product [Psylliodes chrysocephala]